MNDLAVMDTSRRMALLACFEFLIALFQGPDEARCVPLIDQGARELALLCPQGFALEAPVQELVRALPESGGMPALCHELQITYVRLFISNPGGVPAPLYASCHQEHITGLMAEPAREMERRLLEAGLEPDLPGQEPPDHLCVELGYLVHLLAMGWGASPTVDVGRLDQARSFAGEHLLPWVRRFASALSSAPGSDVHRLAVGVLLAAVALTAGEAA